MFKEFALVIGLFVAGCIAGLVYDLGFEESQPQTSITAMNGSMSPQR